MREVFQASLAAFQNSVSDFSRQGAKVGNSCFAPLRSFDPAQDTLCGNTPILSVRLRRLSLRGEANLLLSVEVRFGSLSELAETRHVFHSNLRQHFAIQFYSGLFKALDQLTV